MAKVLEGDVSRLKVELPLEALQQKIEEYTQVYRESQKLIKFVSQHKQFLDKDSLNQLEQLAIGVEEASYVLARFPEYIAPIIELEEYRKIDAVDDEDVDEFIAEYNKATAGVMISFKPGEALYDTLATLQQIESTLRSNENPKIQKQFQTYADKDQLIQLLYQTSAERFSQSTTQEARVNRWNENNPSLLDRVGLRKQKHKVEKESDLLVLAYDDSEDAYAELHRYDSVQSVVNAVNEQQRSNSREPYAEAQIFLQEKLTNYKRAKEAFELLNQQPRTPDLKTSKENLNKSVNYINFLMKHPPAGFEHQEGAAEFLKQTAAAQASLEKTNSLFKKNRPGNSLEELLRIQKEANNLIGSIEHKFEQALASTEKNVRKNLQSALRSVETALYLSTNAQDQFYQRHTHLTQNLSQIYALYAPNYQKIHKALFKIATEVEQLNSDIMAEKQLTAFNQASLLATQIKQSAQVLKDSLPINPTGDSIYTKRLQAIIKKTPDKKMDLREYTKFIAELKCDGDEINVIHSLHNDAEVSAFLKLMESQALTKQNRLTPEAHILLKEESITNALKMANLHFGAEAVVELLAQVDFSLVDNKTITKIAQFLQNDTIKTSDYFLLYGEDKVTSLKSHMSFAKILNEVDSKDLIKLNNPKWENAIKLLYNGFLIDAETAVHMANDESNQAIIRTIGKFCGERACSAISADELQKIFENPVKSTAIGIIFDEPMRDITKSFNGDKKWQSGMLVDLIKAIADDDKFAESLVNNNVSDSLTSDEKSQILQLQLMTIIPMSKDPQAEITTYLRDVLENPSSAVDPHKKILSIFSNAFDMIKFQELELLRESAEKTEMAMAMAINISKEGLLGNELNKINALIALHEQQSIQEQRIALFNQLRPLQAYNGDITKLAETINRVNDLFDEVASKIDNSQELLVLDKTKMRIFEVFLNEPDWNAAMRQATKIMEKTYPSNNIIVQKIAGAFADLKKSLNKLVSKEDQKDKDLEPNSVDYYRDLHKNFKQKLNDLNERANSSSSSKSADNVNLETISSKMGPK